MEIGDRVRWTAGVGGKVKILSFEGDNALVLDERDIERTIPVAQLATIVPKAELPPYIWPPVVGEQYDYMESHEPCRAVVIGIGSEAAGIPPRCHVRLDDGRELRVDKNALGQWGKPREKRLSLSEQIAKKHPDHEASARWWSYRDNG